MAEFKQIGRYIVESVLGEGAMGSVYRAHDPNLERLVAIKTMRTNMIQRKEDYAEFKERFFLESRANGRLNHPNIVSVYDSGLIDKDPYLVMEFIEGKALDAFLSEKGDEYLRHYLPLMEQIAAGLDYAHEEGVIHRDIKPGNILVSLTRSGRTCAKIVDFGLAKLKDSKLTQAGYFLGTPSYASPEQVIGAKLDLRSDLFSFATLSCEMLCGSLPFDAESLHSILYRIANEPPNLHFERFEGLLDVHALNSVFRKALHKKPEARYQSAKEFIEELQRLLIPLKETKLGFKSGKSAASIADLARTSVEPGGQVRMDPQKLNQVNEARRLFQEAIQSKNVSSSKYCVSELERLGVDLSEEMNALESLINEVRRNRAEQRQKERDRLVSSARSAFEMALKTRNISSVEYCLKELVKLKADVTQEQVKLHDLETSLERERAEMVAKEENERASYIQRRRSQLAKALEEKDLQRSGILLKELGSLLKVDVTKEREAMNQIKDELERELEITRTKAAFQDALADRDLKKSRGVIARLKDLGASTAEEEKSLQHLTDHLQKEDQSLHRERVVARAREAFQEALTRKKPESCRYYLQELRLMKVEVDAEERAISQLERTVADEEAQLLRESMVRKLKEEFRRATEQGNIESCRYYLREINQLQADSQEENKLLAGLERRAQAEAELAQNMVQQARDRFESAIKEKNIEGAQQFLRVLAGLGADVTKETNVMLRTQRAIEQAAEKAKLKAKMEAQFRGKFHESYHSGNRDTCKYYLKELMQLGADVQKENQLLETLAT